MDKFVRAGIVTLATTVVLGTAGVAVASASSSTQEPVVKREDTSTSWTQSTNLDDDDLRDDDLRDDWADDLRDDSPTNTVNTAQTRNTAPTKNTVTNNTTTNNTVKTVNSAPTKNTVTSNMGDTN